MLKSEALLFSLNGYLILFSYAKQLIFMVFCFCVVHSLNCEQQKDIWIFSRSKYLFYKSFVVTFISTVYVKGK